MEIITFPLGPLETNSYMLINGSEAVVVDAGGDPTPMLTTLTEKNITLKAILLTHLHFDHTFGVALLHETTKAPVFASENDRWMLTDDYGQGGLWGMPTVPAYDFTPVNAGEISLLHITCKVIETPGHTPGGLCYYFADAKTVFVGDTLFYRSVGRSDFPRGDSPTLVLSIKNGLWPLPDETAVYPGHGIATTIADERKHNPFVM